MIDAENYIDQDAAPAEIVQEVVEEPETETEDIPGQAEEASEEEAEETETGEEAPHKKKSGVQRLKEKLQAEREARIRAEERAKILEEARKPTPVTPTAITPNTKPTKPNIETFEGTHTEYLEARDAWLLGEFESKQEAKAKDEKAKAEVLTREQKWAKSIDEARSRILDLDSILKTDFPLSPVMREELLDSDHGVDIGVYLAKHPKESRRIAEMTPKAATKEIWKLEAKLTESKPETVSKPTTNAPAPPTPAKSRAAAVAAPTKYDGGLEEY